MKSFIFKLRNRLTNRVVEFKLNQTNSILTSFIEAWSFAQKLNRCTIPPTEVTVEEIAE